MPNNYKYDISKCEFVECVEPVIESPTYEVYRYPHGESDLRKHELVATCDSYQQAVNKLTRKKNKDLIADVTMAMDGLEKNPAAIITGTILPAGYYLRRRGEPIYKIIRSWRRMVEGKYKTEQSTEMHYNYDVAMAALTKMRENIVKHRLKMTVDIKMAYVEYPNHTCNCSSATQEERAPVAMSTAIFNRIRDEIVALGINVEVIEGRMYFPRDTSPELFAQANEIRDRILREATESGPPRDSADDVYALLQEIRLIGIPINVMPGEQEHVDIRAAPNATYDQRNVLDTIMNVYAARGAVRTIQLMRDASNYARSMGLNPYDMFNRETPLPTQPQPPLHTRTIDLGSINNTFVINRAHRRLRTLITHPYVRISLGTDPTVLMHDDSTQELQDIIQSMRRIACYDEGAAAVQRERDAFSDMCKTIERLGLDVIITDNNNNTLTITGQDYTHELIDNIVTNYRVRRSSAFLHPDTLEPLSRLNVSGEPTANTQIDFQNMLTEIQRKGIPVNIVQTPNGMIITKKPEITDEQEAELSRIMTAYQERGNGFIKLGINETRAAESQAINFTAQPATHTSKIIAARVSVQLYQTLTAAGINILLDTSTNPPTLVLPQGLSEEQKQFIHDTRRSLVREEMERISVRERVEFNVMVDKIRAAGITVYVKVGNDGQHLSLFMETDAPEEHYEFVKKISKAHKARADLGFPDD